MKSKQLDPFTNHLLMMRIDENLKNNIQMSLELELLLRLSEVGKTEGINDKFLLRASMLKLRQCAESNRHRTDYSLRFNLKAVAQKEGAHGFE